MSPLLAREGGAPGGGADGPYRMQPQPILNAPGIVIALILALVAIHVLRRFLSLEDDAAVVDALAVVPARITALASAPLAEWGGVLATLPGHTLLHADGLHLALNSAWFLVFGTFMARRQTVPAFLLFYGLTGIAGGLAHVALAPLSEVPLIGASGAISGLMGGAARLMFARRYTIFGSEAVVSEVLPLTDRRVSGFALTWIMLNLAFGLTNGFGLVGEGASIAWAAHLGGFLAGLVLVPLMLRR